MKKTVGICSMERFDNRPKNSVGSSRIRVRWLLNYWPEAEEYLIDKKYEVLIFQKVYWQKMMEEFEGVKIMDLCDPDWLEGKPVFEYIDMADAVTTSTQELADFIKGMRPNKKVICVPDRVYIPEHIPVKTKHEGRAKKAVWFGYQHNTHYLYKTFDELITKGIELTLISDKPFVAPLGYKNLKYDNVAYSYPIHAEIIKHDFVLMPAPTDDERARFKSNNKTLQSWAVGMPVVKDPKDLDRFMDPAEREKESKKRLKEIKDKWDVKLSVDQYREIIKGILTEKSAGNK